MNDAEVLTEEPDTKIVKVPIIAALISLAGLVDAIYLTIHHYTGEQVPCGLTGGCEMVLSSQYAEIGGIPLSIFGAAAYFIAFSLALLAAFGNRLMWRVFGFQTALMAAYSVYLIYLQAFVISNNAVPFGERFCQFCLLSAATSLTLFVIALVSRFWRS